MSPLKEAGAIRRAARAIWRSACLIAALCAAGAVGAADLEFHAPASATEASTAAVMRDLAERLLPVYEDSDPDRYLVNLSALQMVAGNYAAADESRQSLRDRRRRADSGRPVGRGAIYDLYARARAREADKQVSFADAFASAFEESVSHLSDHEAYAVSSWLELPPQGFEEKLQALLDEQRSKDIISQDEAVKLIWAFLAFDAYRAFSPLVRSLDAAEDARRYVTDTEVAVPVPGRAKLLVTVVRPKGASAPLPALLELTIEPLVNSARECAAHGYAGIAAHVDSSDANHPPVPYQHDEEDARALIGWVAKQPWSDGRVGMYGEGYSGFTAWAAAKRPPPELKAIATYAPTAPGIDVPMSGNIFKNSAYRWSLKVTTTKTVPDSVFDDDAVWRALNEKWYRSGRPYRDLGRLFGRPNPIFIRWLNHPSYDRFWQTMIPYREEFAHIDIPVLTMSGYFAESEPAALYYFSEHHRYDPHADHTLLIGPYDESVMQHGPSATLRGLEVDPAALIDLRELRYQWLDHVFKGAAPPPLLSDRINYEIMGANEWQHAPSLDAMSGGSLKFYLDASPSGEGRRLARRKSPKSAVIRQTVSFTDRDDAGWLPPADLISRSLVTHDALTFVSEPLSKATRVSGLFKGRLDFAVNKQDMDLNLVFYELLASGDYVRLFNPSDELRLSYVADHSHRHLLKAGERQQLAFRTERITSRQLAQGSRLVVVLRIRKRPDREINYGTGGDVSAESVADGKTPLKVRWYNDSYIEIPARTAARAQ
ncbi:MAG TPA: CocE/NonD family hydrolase [Steroidobacteraceae bacterium]|nr:CocE/NonD family hydrolase [Steroidobacteraceae bacterium]